MVGAAPGDARSTPAAAPTLAEPATILTPILPSPYLPVPASMCASFLFTFSTVSLLVCSFTCPNSPNYLGASNLIIHLGVLNSDPELIEVLFFFTKRAISKKIFSVKTKGSVELLPWHEIFSCERLNRAY